MKNSYSSLRDRCRVVDAQTSRVVTSARPRSTGVFTNKFLNTLPCGVVEDPSPFFYYQPRPLPLLTFSRSTSYPHLPYLQFDTYLYASASSTPPAPIGALTTAARGWVLPILSCLTYQFRLHSAFISDSGIILSHSWEREESDPPSPSRAPVTLALLYLPYIYVVCLF